MLHYPSNPIEAAIIQVLNEDVAEYQTYPSECKAYVIDQMSDKLQVARLIEGGISYQLFEKIQSYSQFSDQQWANILELSTKSLSRYRSVKDFRFRLLHSEKIIEVLEILIKGHDVFGSKDKFQRWMSTSNFALGGNTPADLIRTSYGQKLVMTELTHIDHGIFA